MKITPEFIAKAVPQIDHPVLNSLHNSAAQDINVAVTLYDGDAEILKADVSMLGTVLPQYMAALYFTQAQMSKNHVNVEWTGVRFLNSARIWTRDECKDYMQDALAKHIKADQHKDIFKVIAAANETLVNMPQSSTPPELKEAVDDYAARLAAVFIRETAHVQSPEITAAGHPVARIKATVKKLFL